MCRRSFSARNIVVIYVLGAAAWIAVRLLAGLRHFASSQGCRLVAEGIETEAELSTLVGLNIHAGQGFLLGRPVPILASPGAD